MRSRVQVGPKALSLSVADGIAGTMRECIRGAGVERRVPGKTSKVVSFAIRWTLLVGGCWPMPVTIAAVHHDALPLRPATFIIRIAFRLNWFSSCSSPMEAPHPLIIPTIHKRAQAVRQKDGPLKIIRIGSFACTYWQVQ